MPLKINYSLQRHLQLELKNSRADQRVPKLGQRLKAAIRTVLEIISQHKRNYSPALFSGHECVSGEKSKKYGYSFTLYGSFWKFHS